MSSAVKGTRRYDSAKRREQARQNRWAVLQAARARFLDQGYAATTMNEVAVDAGLSVESVYKMFVNKPGLAKAVFDVSVAGDDEPVEMSDRADILAVVGEPDPARKIDLYCEHLSRTLQRAAPVNLMIRDAAAADPAAADIWEETRREFLFAMTRFAENLHATGRIRPGVSQRDTRDILWSVNSVEMYALLVLQRKWSLKRYVSFLSDTLKHALLP